MSERPRKTLDRAISRAGAMSRKQAQLAIAAGRVRVNGLRVRDSEEWVDLERDAITIDGQRMTLEKRVYLALHKPVGYVTTREDERGRKTVYELLSDVGVWLAPVGRLDRDTSGLLLFTNDSDFAERITNPQSHVVKTYRCLARGVLGEPQIESLRSGVELADGVTRPARVRVIADEGGHTRIELAIDEGRNRQVRRMLEAVGSAVLELERVAIGQVELGALAPGAHRKLTVRELRTLGARGG
jgi:23S rRNA pseudouridine2605 synthase